ncbi:MAG: hypothetical protein IJ141_04535 [Lachnospiraceae bacterium]|nr:hypothetical protein [Lachnospiraceae bacterium]
MKRKMMMIILFLTIAIVLVPAKKSYAANQKGIANLSGFVHYETTESSGDSTGVAEVDATLDRGNKFLKGLCRFIGIAVAVVSGVFFLISLPTHQADSRNQMLIAFFVGIIIIFVPEIVHAISGK